MAIIIKKPFVDSSLRSICNPRIIGLRERYESIVKFEEEDTAARLGSRNGNFLR